MTVLLTSQEKTSLVRVGTRSLASRTLYRLVIMILNGWMQEAMTEVCTDKTLPLTIMHIPIREDKLSDSLIKSLRRPSNQSAGSVFDSEFWDLWFVGSVVNFVDTMAMHMYLLKIVYYTSTTRVSSKLSKACCIINPYMLQQSHILYISKLSELSWTHKS